MKHINIMRSGYLRQTTPKGVWRSFIASYSPCFFKSQSERAAIRHFHKLEYQYFYKRLCARQFFRVKIGDTMIKCIPLERWGDKYWNFVPVEKR